MRAPLLRLRRKRFDLMHIAHVVVAGSDDGEVIGRRVRSAINDKEGSARRDEFLTTRDGEKQ